MSHYKPYPAYRDGGVEWLGDTPEHWVLGKVKNRYGLQLGKMLQPRQEDTLDVEVPYLRAYNVGWETVQTDDIATMWANPKELAQYEALPGDLLVCEGGEAGRAAILPTVPAVEGPLIIQNALHRVRARGGARERFLLYLLQIATTSGWLDVLCNKATIAHFTGDKLANLSVAYPPIAEMDGILNFLDAETAKIDALVEKKTLFIDLLKQKRQTVITQAVTKGLDPSVGMRDFGVDWIGEIPEHWGVTRLGHLTKVSTGGTPDRQKEEYWNGGIPWVKTGEISYSLITSTEENISQLGLLNSAAFVAPAGTVLMAMYGQGVTRGRVAILGIAAAFNQACAAIQCSSKLTNEFLFYYLMAAYSHLRSLGNEASQTNLSIEIIKEIRVPLPSLAEQEAICRQLEASLSNLDCLAGKVGDSLALLNERRTALITAAVTGQIDLREDIA